MALHPGESPGFLLWHATLRWQRDTAAALAPLSRKPAANGLASVTTRSPLRKPVALPRGISGSGPCCWSVSRNTARAHLRSIFAKTGVTRQTQLVRLIVTVAVPESAGVPLSVTCTVSENVGLVSKSTAELLATVIWPVEALIANAPPVLPAVIANVCVCPASGSVNVTVPTFVPLGLFSSIVNVAALTTGGSFTSSRWTITSTSTSREG